MIKPQGIPQFRKGDKEDKIGKETEKEQTGRKNTRRWSILERQVFGEKKGGERVMINYVNCG